MAQVLFEGVDKFFGDNQVLFNIDLQIDSGELVVLLGPSGCGKTTLLRLIAGLEESDRGRIHIGGRPVNGVDPKDRDISMVFQNYALYPHMTVERNMDFGLRIRKTAEEQRAGMVKKAAEAMGLGQFMERKPRQLSGGQRQRVAMSRAIVREPSVYLLDEPLSNLDAKLRNQVRVEIKELQRRLNKTMVYVTHDQSEAMTLADRMVVMDNGVIAQVGSPLEVYNNPVNTMVAGFIGVPAMNLLTARKVKGLTYRIPGGPDLDLPQLEDSPQEITLGVRPEHLHLLDNGPAPEKDDAIFQAQVYLCENHGAETLFNCRAGEQCFVVRFPGTRRVQEGSLVRLAVSPRRIHLFDAAGMSLGKAADDPDLFRQAVGYW